MFALTLVLQHRFCRRHKKSLLSFRWQLMHVKSLMPSWKRTAWIHSPKEGLCCHPKLLRQVACACPAITFAGMPNCQAIDWMSARTSRQIMQEREEMITRLEEANARMWQSGMCDAWLNDAEEGARKVAGPSPVSHSSCCVFVLHVVQAA